MKLVFEKFENSLSLRRDTLNVLRVEDPSLFARCALSLAQGFPSDALEPAYFFSDENKELNTAKTLYFAGDILMVDLNDRRIISQAIKTIVERMSFEGDGVHLLEQTSCQIDAVFEGAFLQMSADYCLADDWDSSKYLKSFGFAIDESQDATVCERLNHFLRVAADLFPEKVIAFVNLPNYLTSSQYNELCETVVALQLCVLSYEQGSRSVSGNLENVLYIDSGYLEE